ncbi:MAG: rhomboid family intramembrane serine protease [Anaerolineae bacterium]|nr:rhomboid family intramembrane serine protease [Anaerolineae bacterium]
MCLLAAILAYFLLILFLSTLLFPMPVNDSGVVRYRTVPWATLTLIMINTAIFVLWIAPDLYGQQEQGIVIQPTFENYVGKINTYGFNEQTLRRGEGIAALATFTSMFMHADFWHLFGNMIYLWAFGRRVEDACGSSRFLLFYLLAGLMANVGSVLLTPKTDTLPSIGASGAISGVMGAYLLLFPGAWVNCLWGVGTILRIPYAAIRKLIAGDQYKFWRWTVSLPAWLVLIWFVVRSFLPSLETIRSDEEIQGVNYLAHLAGFLASLTVFFFVRKDLLLRYLHGRSL